MGELQTWHECSGQEEKIPFPTGNQTPGYPPHNLITTLTELLWLFVPVYLHEYSNANNLQRIFVASASTKGDAELQNQTNFYLNTGRSHFMPGYVPEKHFTDPTQIPIYSTVFPGG